MKGRRTFSQGEIEKFLDQARRQGARPQLKPFSYAFDLARRPDMVLPPRPRADVAAAEAAIGEIRDSAAKAREMYRERRAAERPVEAREYVRHQLALGMLDVPPRRGKRPLEAQPARTESRDARAETRSQGKVARPGFRFWRRRPGEA